MYVVGVGVVVGVVTVVAGKAVAVDSWPETMTMRRQMEGHGDYVVAGRFQGSAERGELDASCAAS